MANATLAQKKIGRYGEKPTLEEAAEREAEVKRRIARKQKRANYGQARARDMDLIEQAQAAQGSTGKAWDPDKQEYVDIKSKEESGPISVLPSEKGVPAAPPYPEYDKSAPPPPPETAEERKIRQAQEELLGKENARKLIEEKRKEEERKRTLIGLGEQILETGRESGSNVSGWLARVPTPGSLWFPLVLLIIFFFILVLFNGHTRLQWAWLVLTGNASFNLGGQGQTTEAPRTAVPPAFGTPQALQLSPQPSTPVGQGNMSPSGLPMQGQPY